MKEVNAVTVGAYKSVHVISSPALLCYGGFKQGQHFMLICVQPSFRYSWTNKE